MKLRSMYPGYIHAVEKYFKKLLPILVPLQYSLGGPIIAFQVENEYGSYGEHDLSKEYMAYLKTLMTNEGISELLFTSDGIKQMEASYYPELPGGEKEIINCQMSLYLILKRVVN
ncbi:beta-galactosidase-1-like protein 2 [Orbicella faveolata]|uniref:beta-galactosidase-1-like protein 2 n=1 Tax=Orbicella faveolata TaxID=48498 RepID=UPI0009E44B15|nr:beta-galactosidase-1-like protein 2 [Orbicella faveolata]